MIGKGTGKVRVRENPKTFRETNKIRDRIRTYIPLLNSISPNANILHANIDKVRLDIKRAYLLRFENKQTHELFLNNLKQSKIFIRNNKSKIFTTRKNRHLGDRWLFEIKMTIMPDYKATGSSYVARIELYLNPSRFINHFAGNAGYLDPVRFLNKMIKTEPDDALETCSHLSPNQYALDGETNIIPEECYRGARPSSQIYEIYLGKVLSLVESELNGAMSMASRNRRLNKVNTILEEWFVSHLEIYWEFHIENAIAFVKKFHDKFMPLLAKTELSNFRLIEDGPTEVARRIGSYAIDNNAPSSKLNLGSNIDLVTYSKELNRIRFEIRFKKNVRAHLGLSSDQLPISASESRKLILKAIDYSSRKMSKIFAYLPNYDAKWDIQLMSLLDFVIKIDEVARTYNLSSDLKRLLSALSVNGALTAVSGSDVDRFCKHLVKSGILKKPTLARNKNSTRKYHLTSPYLEIFLALSRTEFKMP